MTAENLHLSTSTNPLADAPASQRFLPWLLVLFVGSGCAALVYEIVWLQLLQLLIGSSGISLGVLLGTFMGGMCLGSLVLPYVIPARWHPLRVYAFIEIGIGVIGLAVWFGMPYVQNMYVDYVGHAGRTVWMRAAVAAICLIPPTLLMGATLPAIARWVESTPRGVSWLGFFYGGNIVGAVFGCLLAGFFLLPRYDMPTATYVAVAINFVVAAIAFILAAQTPHVVRGAAPTDDDDMIEAEVVEPAIAESAQPASGPVYLVIALSGFMALGAEVIWTRLLSLMLGATVYTFSIILAVFLVGLGIGSSVGASMARNVARPRLALGVCQLLLAGAVGWAAWVITQSLPYWPIDPSHMGKTENSPLSYPWYNFQLDLVRAAWAMLPAAVLWGASFPLALASVARRGSDPGRMVGGVYAANTVGAIGGALVFAMMAIPSIGTQWSQRVIIMLAGVSAMIAMAPYLLASFSESDVDDVEIGGVPTAPAGFSLAGSIVLVVFATASLVGLVWSVKPMPWVTVAFGRNGPSWMSQCDLRQIYTEDKGPTDGMYSRYCTYWKEGMNVTVAVTKDSSGFQYFHGAGKVQASSDPQDMRLQRMLGHLSVLAHNKPDEVRDVLVVACGAGVTAGSFIPYPKIENVVICDIEPLVPQYVTPKFTVQNYGVTDNVVNTNPRVVNGKKVEVAYDDGRHYIRTLPPDKKFDIITSDPIDPWVKGCAALNTEEYYTMCRDHLKPGGVMSLWIPLYESNEATAKSVIATFFKVFPNGMIFSNEMAGRIGYDAVLFGTVEAPQINIDEVRKLLETAEYRPVKESLMEVGFGNNRNQGAPLAEGADTVVELLATYAGRGPDLVEWGKDALINSDRNLRLQYLAGMWLNSDEATKILDGVIKYYRFPDQVFLGSPDSVLAMKRALEAEGRVGSTTTQAKAN